MVIVMHYVCTGCFSLQKQSTDLHVNASYSRMLFILEKVLQIFGGTIGLISVKMEFVDSINDSLMRPPFVTSSAFFSVFASFFFFRHVFRQLQASYNQSSVENRFFHRFTRNVF